MDNRSNIRTRIAVWLCVAMLLVCLLALAHYLRPVYQNQAADTLDGSAMGMMLIDIPDTDAASFYHVQTLGVYVLAVDEKSLAYELGVRSGDRIVSLNGREITSSSELADVQASFAEMQEMQLVFRKEDGSQLQTTLKYESEER